MLENLKQEVYEANIFLKTEGLIIFTWGNVSAIDLSGKYVVIKPSGVAYDDLTADKMVVCDLDGNVVEGKLKPSSDLMTHLEIYKANKNIKGVCHTHSPYATIWAQSGRSLPCYGTTHADYFPEDVICTSLMSKSEIENDYELNTGKIIVSTLKDKDLSMHKAILVASHGPFTWGDSAMESVEIAKVLEYVAHMAKESEDLNVNIKQVNDVLHNKHFYRKHGVNAYYGNK